MMLGVGAIAFSSAGGEEQVRWREAAAREGLRYGVAADFVEARMDGRSSVGEVAGRRRWWDFVLIVAATGVFVVFGWMARVPRMDLRWGPALLLSLVSLGMLAGCGVVIWRTTRFQ
jgi:hypothetical protein